MRSEILTIEFNGVILSCATALVSICWESFCSRARPLVWTSEMSVIWTKINELKCTLISEIFILTTSCSLLAAIFLKSRKSQHRNVWMVRLRTFFYGLIVDLEYFAFIPGSLIGSVNVGQKIFYQVEKRKRFSRFLAYVWMRRAMKLSNPTYKKRKL